jgi:uncharacterized protein involved in exopolysaccharide biosynthesis
VSEILPFTLHRLIQVLADRQRVAGSIVAACVLLSILYLHVTPQTYTVQMQVVTTVSEGTAGQANIGASAALLSQLGSGHSSTATDNFELYLAGLDSIETARILSGNRDLMHRIFASEWSARDQSWRSPPSISGSVIRFIKGILGIYVPPWQPPDATRVEEFLRGNITVSRSIVSPVVDVSIQTGDPKFGVDLLNSVHQAVDGILRHRTLARVSGYIGYLNSLIQNATVVEYRMAVTETILQQEKVRMTAASSAPYAADVFARATPSRIPTQPKGIIVLAGGIFAGIFLALVEAVLCDRFGAYRKLLARGTMARNRAQSSRSIKYTQAD